MIKLTAARQQALIPPPPPTPSSSPACWDRLPPSRVLKHTFRLPGFRGRRSLPALGNSKDQHPTWLDVFLEKAERVGVALMLLRWSGRTVRVRGPHICPNSDRSLRNKTGLQLLPLAWKMSRSRWRIEKQEKTLPQAPNLKAALLACLFCSTGEINLVWGESPF